MTMRITRRIAVLALTLLSGLTALNTYAGDDAAAGPSVYERLGEMDGTSILTTPVRKLCQAADYTEAFAHDAYKVNAAPNKQEIDVTHTSQSGNVQAGTDILAALLRPADAGAVEAVWPGEGE